MGTYLNSKKTPDVLTQQEVIQRKGRTKLQTYIDNPVGVRFTQNAAGAAHLLPVINTLISSSADYVTRVYNDHTRTPQEQARMAEKKGKEVEVQLNSLAERMFKITNDNLSMVDEARMSIKHTGSTSNYQQSQDVRHALQAMSHSEVIEAVKSDPRVASVFVNDPKIIYGFNDKQHDNIDNQVLQTYQPAAYAAKQSHTSNINAYESILKETQELVSLMYNKQDADAANKMRVE
jgi:hypothetical protein